MYEYPIKFIGRIRGYCNSGKICMNILYCLWVELEVTTIRFRENPPRAIAYASFRKLFNKNKWCIVQKLKRCLLYT